MGKGGQTIGYHYLMTVYSGICCGSIDELVEIRADSKQAWVGSVSDATPQVINKPNLFGGEKREGGLQGAFRLLQGGPTQILPADVTVSIGASSKPLASTVIQSLKNLISQPIGEMRGFASVIYDGLVCSISPYPKQWTYRIARNLSGWHNDIVWYPAKATITLTGDGNYTEEGFDYRTTIKAANPTHIIYQALTNPDWGAGEPTSQIDENSFIYAANQLCAEGFGLCLNWTRQEDVNALIQVVVDHIGAVMYIDRKSGKYVLRLIRADYTSGDLPLYTMNSGLLAIEDDDSASGTEAINEIIASGRDIVTNEPFEVRVQNIASITAAGQINSESVEYKGIATRALLIRLAQRDLAPHSTGLKRLRLRLDRRARNLAPGMPIRISVPSRGIGSMVVRIGEIDTGSLRNGEISARVIEDIFALPDSSFALPVMSDWAPLPRQALPAAAVRLIEAGYRDLYVQLGTTGLAEVENTSGYIGQLAAAPNSSTIEYDLLSKTSVEPVYTTASYRNFTGTALLTAAVGPLDTLFAINAAVDIDSDLIGQALMIDDEIVKLSAIGVGTITVTRGCADSIPESHLAGARVWTVDDDLASDDREFATGEIVSTKVLTRTGSDRLTEIEAVTETVTLISRHALPFPPGNVRVNGDGIYTTLGVYAVPLLAWTHRDRIAQADALVAHSDASVGPEPGTTYRVRIYSLPADTLLRTEGGIAGTSFTYTALMQTADGNPESVRFVLDSQRDGFSSWKAYSFIVHIIGGYGRAYGLDYGGAP